MTMRWLVLVAFLFACAGPRPVAPAAPPALRQVPAVNAPSAPRAVDPADRTASAPMPVDPAVRAGQLPSGMRYFLRAHPRPEHRAALRLVVDAGAVLETEEQRGLAHFIEHMAFNGTRLFKKQELIDFLERAGMRFGSDANASTSFDETIYTFTVPTEDPAVLGRALLVLEQIAHEVTFDPVEVDRERGVVIEEWRLGLGAEMRVLEQVIPVIFQGSRYAERMPIGKMAVLEHAGAADLRRFYDRWYRPDLMAVVAVGDFDAAAVEREIHKAFAPIPRPTTPADRPVYPVPSQPQTLVAVARDPELTATSVGILHKMPRRPDLSEGDYRRHIVEGLYHGMLNARLEEQSRATDPPFLSAASTTEDLVRPTEVFAQVAAVRQDAVSRGLEAIAREVERVDRHGFTPGELARAKAETLRRMQALAKERQNLPSDAFADELVRHYLTGEAVPGIEAELRLHQRYLPTVALPEMNVIARDWLRERDRVLLVEAPKAAKVPSGEALLGVLGTVKRSPLPPYVDRASDRPLLARRPAGGRITSTHRLPALDVTEWRLSNGVRVVVKPTTFKRDEVLLAAVSPGGASLVGDRDYLSARFAGEIVGQSGYGPFDPTELRNVLAGKLVSISPAIDELTEGVLAEASPDDLQTLFELVYLAFTAPRRDERVFAAFQAQLADQLAHRTADPEEAFADRRLAVLFGGHPRRHPLQPGDEKRIALDRVLDIYRSRFANAADFTFVLVGNVQPNTLAPLVSRYLGALPARGAHERWKDRGVRPVPGVHRFEVRQGIEPKSLVDLVFTGPERWSREEDQRLRSLIEVLGIRLREVLREGMSGTYSVGVTGDLQRRPDQEYRAEITFGCAPQNVEPLVGATFAELEALRAGKLPEGYLAKVQAAQRRALEQATTTNGYWLGHLVEHYQYGTDPTLILHERELIDGVTEGGLEQTAQRVFDQHRYLLGLLQPQRSAVSAGPAAAPP